MKFRLKNKIMLSASGMLIVVMLISTVAVSVIVDKQNREGSNQLLKNSFNIIRDTVSEREEILLTNTSQMAVINDMGGNIQFVIKEKTTVSFDIMKDTYETIVQSICNIGTTANMWKASIYDLNGDLIGAVVIDDKGVHLGYVHNRTHTEGALLKPGDKLTEESWKEGRTLPGVAAKLGRELPREASVRFEEIEGFLCLVSYVPIIGERYNNSTEKMEKKQFGVAMAVQKLDSVFADRVSRLAGTRVNIFIGEGLSAGTLKEYEKFDLNGLAGESKAQDMEDQAVLFSDITVKGSSYFQGVLPVYSGTECLAAIVSLYSKEVAEANTWQMVKLLILVSLVCILIFLPLAFFFANSLTKPILKVVAGLKDIAEGEGDLTIRLEVNSKDEVGELAKWFNVFMEKLQGIVKEIAENADTLNTSSDDLLNLSGQMSEGADNMSGKSEAVATAAEEMSSNMNSVAAAMEQAATNMNMVATSTEEMTSTVNEIARNSEKASAITGEAVTQAESASERVAELGNAAQDIGKVTETITEISEQTNLLALNATIEAARAGEAGKGFAVVANEIKELARQTAEATQEIKAKIEGIQGSTSGTVKEIGQISKVINDMNEIVSTIAASVEEQSVTTKEIANNVNQASQGIQEVNENVAQSSVVSGEIAKDISNVNQESKEMSNGSSQVKVSAGDLSRLAEELKALVGRFKVEAIL